MTQLALKVRLNELTKELSWIEEQIENYNNFTENYTSLLRLKERHDRVLDKILAIEDELDMSLNTK
jgi:hypothetical protein